MARFSDHHSYGSGATQQVVWAQRLVVVLFLLLLLRLFYLQIVAGGYFRELSENNRLRTVYLSPSRGLILDRQGELLAKNRPAFDLELIREDVKDPRETLATVENLLGLESGSLTAQMAQSRRRRKFEPILLKRDISREQMAKIFAWRFKLPGILITPSTAREYPYQDAFVHALGYIREISARQLEQPDFLKYRSGDFIGQSGVEGVWERFLRGTPGVQDIVVNAVGTKLGEAHFESSVAGDTISLTIDARLQRAAHTALGEASGAVVALDVRTGAVLALVSHPTFDPNLFSRPLSQATWESLTIGDRKPLNNRAVQGLYPPGSVFKVFMAIAALTEGITTAKEIVFCPGSFTLGKKKFRCHKPSGHGWVDLEHALAASCDVYFYTMGLRLGIDKIHEYATKFGFGSRTGVSLGDEPAGLVPSTEWKRRAFKNPDDQRWYPGETPSVVIGQGATMVTPLQVARAIAAVVNGGKLFVPYVVSKISSPQRPGLEETFEPHLVGDAPVQLSAEAVALARKGMEAVVNDVRGTGARAKLDPAFGVIVAGKTGTAQVATMGIGKGKQFEDHAWFAGYAPAQNPEIVVVAIAENSGHGGSVAAPVVRQVMEVYFADRRVVGEEETKTK